MEDLTVTSAAVLPIVYFLVEWAKKAFGDNKIFERILPLMPVLIAFGLSWIPGLGMASAAIGAKILFAFAAGGIAGTGQQVIKKTVMGKTKAAEK